MRIFIALKPAEEFLERLQESTRVLREKYPNFRWIPKENLHITLVFLGEVDQTALLSLKEAVKTASEFREIHAAGGPYLFFPGRGSANALALGFNRGGDEITALSEELLKNLDKQGIHPGGTGKNGFSPHITLARKGKEPLRFMDNPPSISIEGLFNSLALYKSELYREGARYTILEQHQLEAVS